LSCNGTKRTFSLLSKAAIAATVSAAISLPATGAFASTTQQTQTTHPAQASRPIQAARTAHAARMSAAQWHEIRLTHIRLGALRWAQRQTGKWYCYGGTGPYCYDCSGLVFSAYHHMGVWLPRDTYGMLASDKLRWIPAWQAKPGDLAFYGIGHVELVVRGGTFGALDYGALVGTHPANPWFYPTMFYTLR